MHSGLSCLQLSARRGQAQARLGCFWLVSHRLGLGTCVFTIPSSTCRSSSLQSKVPERKKSSTPGWYPGGVASSATPWVRAPGRNPSGLDLRLNTLHEGEASYLRRPARWTAARCNRYPRVLPKWCAAMHGCVHVCEHRVCCRCRQKQGGRENCCKPLIRSAQIWYHRNQISDGAEYSISGFGQSSVTFVAEK